MTTFAVYFKSVLDMPVDAVLGLQWGDEGKGKIVDFLANQYQAVCRFQGGPNAGHTLYLEGEKCVLHTLPSGIFRSNVLNLIGNGVVIDPITLVGEMERVRHHAPDLNERLFVSERAHLILPTHRWIDMASEQARGQEKIGSTLRGIGPCYMDKTGRNGLRAGELRMPSLRASYQALKEKHLQFLKQFPKIDFDLDAEERRWFEAVDHLMSLRFVNSPYWMASLLDKGANLLAEGAQGTMLDVDQGTYPYVTSSNTIAAGISTGLGIAPSSLRRIVGIAKAYCTRVGAGPFPSELEDETGERLRKAGNEFGSTTGRPRRCGWMDLVQLRYACLINGVTDLCITKIDVLNGFDEVGLADAYIDAEGNGTQEMPMDPATLRGVSVTKLPGWNWTPSKVGGLEQLPDAMRHFIEMLCKGAGVPISMLSFGPEREHLLTDL
ncbi:MAG: Adenylosuccinate synthetase [Saprospiraceae bacterium]|jgi:adenylosuccinate synthase|nr:Adenylosuccinate synthetase [Saprospiraceae bacterium]